MPNSPKFEIISDPDSSSDCDSGAVPLKKTKATQTDSPIDDCTGLFKSTFAPDVKPESPKPVKPLQHSLEEKVRYVFNPRRISHYGNTHTISCSITVKPFEDANKLGAITPILLDAKKCLYDELSVSAPGLQKPFIRLITYRVYHADLFPPKDPLFLRFTDNNDDAYIPITTRVAGIKAMRTMFSLQKPFIVFLDITTAF